MFLTLSEITKKKSPSIGGGERPKFIMADFSKNTNFNKEFADIPEEILMFYF